MIVRRQGKRGATYGVRIWVQDDTVPGGRRHEWVGTYPTKGEAREAQSKAELARSGRGRGRPVWTVKEFSERWLERYHGPNTKRRKDATLELNRDAIKVFVKQHGHRKLRDIDPGEARDHATEFPWRAKAVKAMFADAVRDGKLSHSPFDGVQIAKPKGRAHIKPLTMAEIERLAEIAQETLGFYGSHFAAFVLIHGWTGMRPGEVCRIEWADIDWDAGKLSIPDTKTDHPRRIRLAAPALDVFRSIPRLDDFVFHTARGKRMKSYSYAYFWQQVRAAFATELPEDHWLPRRLRKSPDDRLDIYETRHACASMLIAEGLTYEEVAEYLGNSPQVCRDTYTHLFEDRYEERVAAAFERIGRNFARPTGTETGSTAGEDSA